MTIYKLRISYAHEGNTLSYHGSYRAAADKLAEEKEENEKAIERGESDDKIEDSEITPYNFPCNKNGFLAFLNQYTPSRDNG